PAIVEYRKHYPVGPLAVVLTGTDLYKDLPASRAARQSLELADRLIVLQDDALRRLRPKFRKKARVVYQSARASVRHAPKGKFRVVVAGHMRDVKDPFRTALALGQLDQDLDVVQVG